MFTIADGRDRLYQWDIDVKLLISEAIASGIDEAHFTAKYSRECLTVKVVHTDTESYVMVPNILLQTSYDIVVYAFCCTDKITKHIQEIPVMAKPKPADYVYTETEILAYWTLEKRLSDLEQSGGVTDEQIANAIFEYLEEHPIETPDIADQVARAETAASNAEDAMTQAQNRAYNAAGSANAAYNAALRAEQAATRAEEAAANVGQGSGGTSGIPKGGKVGQYLRKQSDADGDVVWSDLEIPEQYGLVTYDQNKTITIT